MLRSRMAKFYRAGAAVLASNHDPEIALKFAEIVGLGATELAEDGKLGDMARLGCVGLLEESRRAKVVEEEDYATLLAAACLGGRIDVLEWAARSFRLSSKLLFERCRGLDGASALEIACQKNRAEVILWLEAHFDLASAPRKKRLASFGSACEMGSVGAVAALAPLVGRAEFEERGEAWLGAAAQSGDVAKFRFVLGLWGRSVASLGAESRTELFRRACLSGEPWMARLVFGLAGRWAEAYLAADRDFFLRLLEDFREAMGGGRYRLGISGIRRVPMLLRWLAQTFDVKPDEYGAERLQCAYAAGDLDFFQAYASFSERGEAHQSREASRMLLRFLRREAPHQLSYSEVTDLQLPILRWLAHRFAVSDSDLAQAVYSNARVYGFHGGGEYGRLFRWMVRHLGAPKAEELTDLARGLDPAVLRWLHRRKLLDYKRCEVFATLQGHLDLLMLACDFLGADVDFQRLFAMALCCGHLSVASWCLEQLKGKLSPDKIQACYNGQDLRSLRFLVDEFGPPAEPEKLLEASCASGDRQLPVSKWLHRTFRFANGAKVVRLFVAACEAGHWQTLRWLRRAFAITREDIKVDLLRLFYRFCETGLSEARWFWRVFALTNEDVGPRRGKFKAFAKACYAGRRKVAQWLYLLYPPQLVAKRPCVAGFAGQLRQIIDPARLPMRDSEKLVEWLENLGLDMGEYYRARNEKEAEAEDLRDREKEFRL